jgi:hypothetical protein
MINEELLRRIEYLLTYRQLSKKEDANDEIEMSLAEIFDELATVTTYEDARRLRSWLFEISENYHDSYFAFLFVLHKKQLALLRSSPLIFTPGEVDVDVDYRTLTDFLPKLIRTLMTGQSWLRLSEDITFPTDIPPEILMGLLSLVIDIVQYDCGEAVWKREDFKSTIMLLVAGRQLARITQRLDLFYGLLGVVIDRLNISQEYQMCRDFSEEVLLTSVKDGRREWGYFLLFKAYNGQFNASLALMHVNACIAVVRNLLALPDRLFKLLLFELQRFYRNIHFREDSNTIYRFMIGRLPLDRFEVFDITITHLMTLLRERDASVIIALYEYLSNNREFIFEGRKGVALPLLNTLYNVSNIFRSHPDVLLLEEYIPILESMVNEEDALRFRTIAYGDSSHLKELYVAQLLSLNETRTVEDFVNEIHTPLIVADRLVKYAFELQTINCFLLAMILKADYSLLFQEKEVLPHLITVPTISRQIDKAILSTYDNYDEYVIRNLEIERQDVCMWLAVSDGKVYALQLKDKNFMGIVPVEGWYINLMHEWLFREFKDLFFDETVKEQGQIRQYLEDDQLHDLEKVRSMVGFTRFDIQESGGLLLIKDMAVSGMPHNLLLSGDGNFISLKRPVTCLPSTEWYIINSSAEARLPHGFTTAMWIPTEGGDLALNLLWSRLEERINALDITVTNAEVPTHPLGSDINVLSAHGASDISAFHAFSTRSGAAVIDMDRIVGAGSVLVLLVCHAGSMDKDLFRNKILSLVRKFLTSGYQAVVAPFWSLHVSIPPIWLPQFLTSMKRGITVSESVFAANYKVYEANKSPGAWACLHLYGNPYLKTGSNCYAR